MQVPPPLVVVERLIYRRVGDRLPDPDLCPVWEGPTEQVRDVTADEQGPDTADLDRILATFALYGGKEPPRESEGWYLRWALGEVRSLRGEIIAARSERATALAELAHVRSLNATAAAGSWNFEHTKAVERAEAAEAAVVIITAENADLRENVSAIQIERNDLWHAHDEVRAELSAVTAERDRWEKAALDWSEESVRHRGEIRRLGETLAVERKQAAAAVVTARRDALLEAADAWEGAASIARWLRARASTQTPAAHDEPAEAAGVTFIESPPEVVAAGYTLASPPATDGGTDD